MRELFSHDKALFGSCGKWLERSSGAMQRQADGSWVADQENGRVSIVFVPRNDFGVLDHAVTLADGSIVQVPLRVIRNNDGSELIFTLFRQPGMDDALFERDAAWIAQDLAKLKMLLENAPRFVMRGLDPRIS